MQTRGQRQWPLQVELQAGRCGPRLAPHRGMDERSFVPEGIDQDSWLGFEQRIQQRRAQALADTARHALDTGDRRTALEALTEARTLSPGDSELDELERQLERPHARTRRRGWQMAVAVTVVAMAWFAFDTSRDPVEVPAAPAPAETYSTPVPPPAATSGVTEIPEPAGTPARPTAPPATAAPAIPAAAPPAPPLLSTDEDRVAFALKRYGRTFTGLNLADCAMTMRGASATAVCRTAGDSPIWDVELSRQDEGWMIDSAVAREK